MPLKSVPRHVLAAAVAILALGPDAHDAVAGTAATTFEVRASLVTDNGCRAGSDHLVLSCGSPSAPNVLQPRPESSGLTLADGWLTYGNRTEAYDSVYAASLTTRVIRYREWEYIETLVSW